MRTPHSAMSASKRSSPLGHLATSLAVVLAVSSWNLGTLTKASSCWLTTLYKARVLCFNDSRAAFDCATRVSIPCRCHGTELQVLSPTYVHKSDPCACDVQRWQRPDTTSHQMFGRQLNIVPYRLPSAEHRPVLKGQRAMCLRIAALDCGHRLRLRAVLLHAMSGWLHRGRAEHKQRTGRLLHAFNRSSFRRSAGAATILRQRPAGAARRRV